MSFYAGEEGYLRCVADLIRKADKGLHQKDRTGVGSVKKPGVMFEYDLTDMKLPLFTHKKVFTRGIFEELLWFIAGKTDSKELEDKKIGIWRGNTSREFLDKRGLFHYPEGDTGPMYGFNWRHFGAEYGTCKDDYSGKGFDQLAHVVKLLREKSEARNIMMTAYNPAQLDQAVLPPCHAFVQWVVEDGTDVTCVMNQRSADMGLGVPFNVASYALLTHMLCHVTGLRAVSLKHVCGDCHLYLDHVPALRNVLDLETHPSPTVKLNDDVKEIDEFTMADIAVENYRHGAVIKMKMAV